MKELTFLGVRHHSPACARLVERTIDALRPAHVLVEGPADFNPRMDELLLGHTPPVAIFSYRRGEHVSWTPFCDYSPEWVALTSGRAAGARVRFIDLPAWHPAFAERHDHGNRYADAERRYTEVTDRLCRAFGMDNVDTLWDHVVESRPESESTDLAERLDTYFDLVRGEAEAGECDTEREAYMAGWVRAAVREGDGPVLVVTGGFHRPALEALCAVDDGEHGWPAPPDVPEDAGSYLVPYSHRRLDAFAGYQAGMPSPGYYQRLWESGPAEAATGLIADVVTRLRAREQVVSTADLIAARTLADGLAALRGHPQPVRADVLDGLVSALVSDALDQPLPWSVRGTLQPGAHPVVVEMLAALTGDRVGVLHPETPAPPLLTAVTHELHVLGLDGERKLTLDLTRETERSRTLHRLRVLGVPGFRRDSGPSSGGDPVSVEKWTLEPSELRVPALVEASAHGPTLAEAAAAVLREQADGGALDIVATTLFDTVLCGLADLGAELGGTLAHAVTDARELGPLGEALAGAVGLYRHDRLLGAVGSPLLGEVVAAAAPRVLWLAESLRAGPAPAEPARLRAIAAVRDAVTHTPEVAGVQRDVAAEVGARIAEGTAPPDLRGAGLGLCWVLGAGVDAAAAVPRDPGTVGDWLAGLFAVAREEVLGNDELIGVLDDVVTGLSEDEFLVALPALRQAFGFFPPSERAAVADGLLHRRGLAGSGRSLLRLRADPAVVAEGVALEAAVDEVLRNAGLEEW
ncbi:DUF5682 family protein [Saccharomonospora cyanea]|uniref:Uncharacterized protein n=1 Tax=Saccharomonospora cyanea NA-134 TaxID=882082 RepID=H5XPN9_9PSEU|nr:DUF5682 family protein [Saccharomonospora cyanea]EHR61117.1 hypothetical protein SaccyDRAFT_2233 [Saccharomonospora cyanea NA-134]